MKRKVNRVGQSTLTISLPNKWAKAHKIEKGDELLVEIDHEKLTISPEEHLRGQQKEAHLTLTHNEHVSIRSILGAYYKKGFDILRIKYDSDEIFSLIRDATNNLIGYEIIEKKPGYCVVKSYLQETEEEFRQTMQKLIHTVKTSQQATREDYIKGSYSSLLELEDYRYSGWKLRDLALRILEKKNLYYDNTIGYTIILWTLEKFNRNYKRMYRIMKENNLKATPDILKIYDELTALFAYFAESIYKPDTGRAEHIHKEHERLVKAIFAILPKSGKNTLALSYILENTRRMQDLVSSLVMIQH